MPTQHTERLFVNMSEYVSEGMKKMKNVIKMLLLFFLLLIHLCPWRLCVYLHSHLFHLYLRNTEFRWCLPIGANLVRIIMKVTKVKLSCQNCVHLLGLWEYRVLTIQITHWNKSNWMVQKS